jgi:purine-nucleoside phosphorylase
MRENGKIDLALILGSGIELDDNITNDKSVFYIETSGIHKKIIYTCSIAGKTVLVFQGRKHFYEGHNYEDIIHNVKTAHEMGAKNLLITNAAGGLNDNFSEGDLMLIKSHINFNGKLFYPKTAFPVSQNLVEILLRSASAEGIKIHEGVYGYLTGPTYETKAEIRAQRKMGTDAVGMSTIPEIYEAAKLGMNVIAVSVITNLLKENNIIPASHDDVVLTAKTASKSLNIIIQRLVSELN